MSQYPDFESLPTVDGQPQGNTWGLWGKDDELGTLNYLTHDVIRNAAREIKAGISIQLDFRLDYLNHRPARREGFEHRIKDFKAENKGTGLAICAHDDVLTFNTQGSSQWDGLRHVGLQHSGTYYNGVKHQDITGMKHDGRLGIHRWVERGGIVGRGVLLDYHGWRQQTGQPTVAANSAFAITTEELDAVAKHQGTEFHAGDILIIRSGFSVWYQQASKEEQIESIDRGAFIGLESSMEVAKWLWNHHFAAVAGDTVGFECHPVNFGDKDAVILHEWLLAHWGTPIGELWDLEKLAKVCREKTQWSFFLTSAPLHVFGGVGTTPNVIAIL
ncbi:uncharacterized protein Z519_07668 [Cladophialophora bantiana CBS 173.52]|uniref:Cyclase n=1 Tax=Cladophialophora bantiana (strain ATCC 10958 / CBS 173.52 / CDC B-1940 / NIH 8579) TaxID=1442370 RepID=A0A0D2HLP1_CLAB1|nr:uncharacterized protein Z519_07668 [Cladophialophora bantiana CBS 173.52]KIW91700.1 hypothetical protein Z519_07668 [Cladophialophora bantiana CBS 173.52]